MLINCTALGEKRLEKAKIDFANHKTLISDAKNDLDVIFKKIRNMKQILAKKFPDVYEPIASKHKLPLEEEE